MRFFQNHDVVDWLLDHLVRLMASVLGSAGTGVRSRCACFEHVGHTSESLPSRSAGCGSSLPYCCLLLDDVTCRLEDRCLQHAVRLTASNGRWSAGPVRAADRCCTAWLTMTRVLCRRPTPVPGFIHVACIAASGIERRCRFDHGQSGCYRCRDTRDPL